jgi:hypothetical protein
MKNLLLKIITKNRGKNHSLKLLQKNKGKITP